MDKESRMEELCEILNKWSNEYYNLDNPSVSDREYDSLYDELRRLERETGKVLENSPTKKVGGEPVKGFEKHKHIARLYSLDKAVSREELDGFFARVGKFGPVSYTVEYKYDGLTMCLTYEDGKFVRAATRGNGTEGEDVTAQALTVKSFPLTVGYPGKLEVRGEAIIRLSVLEEYNRLHPEEPLKNARNAAAGAIRNFDPKITLLRKPEILFYDVNYMSSMPVSQKKAREFLEEENFQVYPYFKYCETEEEVRAAIDEIELSRGKIDVLTDGAVVKVNEESVREKLGYTDKFPRWAIAYKFEAEEAETTVKEVVWQVGRTGKLTPLAKVESVDLGGATVRRATLNNFGDLTKKRVKIGSRVMIRRSNEVIPEILGAVGEEEGKSVQKPAVCPVCSAPVAEIGANLFCTNEECPSRVVQKLTHYCSKNAADIEGMSESTLDHLYRKRKVRNFSDLYTLTEQSFEGMEGFREKKISSLLKAIEKSKNIPLDRFLYAIGIEGIGRVAARDLARFGSVDKISSLSLKELTALENIGQVTAKAIFNYFADEKNREELFRLELFGVKPLPPRKSGEAFAGETVVFTGGLSSMSRSEAQKAVEEQGGSCGSDVSKKTTLVVAGEKSGGKREKAESLKIPILTEEEFLARLGGKNLSK